MNPLVKENAGLVGLTGALARALKDSTEWINPDAIGITRTGQDVIDANNTLLSVFTGEILKPLLVTQTTIQEMGSGRPDTPYIFVDVPGAAPDDVVIIVAYRQAVTL